MKLRLFSLAILLALSICSSAQYTFSTFTESFVPLVDATNIELGDDWDDPEFIIQPGFEFQVGNSTTTELLQLGLGGMLGNITGGDFNVFGYFSDLANGANITGAAESTITYSLTGAVGNRIFKLQYTNCAFYSEVFANEPSAQNRTNFQIWLYEIDSAIELHFGTSSITDADLVYDGFPGPQIAIALGVSIDGETLDYGYGLTGPPSSPTFTPLSIENQNFSLSGTPESGRVYRFAPSAPVSTENRSEKSFSVYPTLANDVINVEGVDGNATYRIFDLTGQEVATGLLNKAGILSVNSLNAGVYLFSIDGMGKSAKFIKQ